MRAGLSHRSILAISFALAIAASPASADDACTAELDGHVVDAVDHEPMPGVAITVGGQQVAESDPAGRFVLSGLCPGALVLDLSRADAHPQQRTIQVAAGRRRVALEAVLDLLGGEVVELHDTAPPPTDLRSTTTLTGRDLQRTRGRGLAEALAEVPGVAQLGAASGLAKPIVRGQFGRRLLLLVDGIRHRAQDWGVDHAPEVDPFVAGAITVVRGAAGVRYGPDAIGGAIVVEPPPLRRSPGTSAEAHLTGSTNARGGSIAARVQHAPAAVPGLVAQLEASAKRLAGARTPRYALDNTGVREWNIGATAGYTRGDLAVRLAYAHYQATLGVCSCLHVETADAFFAQLARERPLGSELYAADFPIDRPSQAVGHDRVVARGELGALTASYAFQYDHRREYDVVRDAVTGPQHDFRLSTHDADVAYAHRPLHLGDHLHLRGTVGAVGVAQFHAYTGLPLVPDHRSLGAGAYAIERLIGDAFELEAGVRYDVLARRATLERIDFLRLVRSDQLAEDACGDASGDRIACASTFHTASASLGGLYRWTPALTTKLELSTASRPPNTDEQYLNGTAPTFPVLGLGKPDLGAETTYSASLTASYRTDRAALEASVFANRIDDYIELAPAIGADGLPIFDVLIRGTYPRFVTRPVDAEFHGADAGARITPWPWLELAAQAAVVRAQARASDRALAFIPPDRARASIAVQRAALWGLRDTRAELSATGVRRQTRYDLATDLAPPPPGHVLVGAEIGGAVTLGGRPIELAIQGSNLLDRRYREYTSLLRYFADQPGRAVLFRLSVRFDTSDP